MWELDHKEGWAPKNGCFLIAVQEKTLECPLDCREIKPVNPKGNQHWICIGKTNAEAEAPILQVPNVKNWLIWKDPDAEKDWRWEEKGMTEDEMAGWHHRLNGHEFEQTPGDSEGQRNLAYCSPWGHKEPDITSWLNNNNKLMTTNCFLSGCYRMLPYMVKCHVSKYICGINFSNWNYWVKELCFYKFELLKPTLSRAFALQE